MSFLKSYWAIKNTSHMKKFGADVSSVIPLSYFLLEEEYTIILVTSHLGLVFLFAILFWTQKISLDIEVMLTLLQEYVEKIFGLLWLTWT